MVAPRMRRPGSGPPVRQQGVVTDICEYSCYRDPVISFGAQTRAMHPAMDIEHPVPFEVGSSVVVIPRPGPLRVFSRVERGRKPVLYFTGKPDGVVAPVRTTHGTLPHPGCG